MIPKQGIGRTTDDCCMYDITFSGTCDLMSSVCEGNQGIIDAIAEQMTDNASGSSIGECGMFPIGCSSCSNRICGEGQEEKTPPPNNTECTGASQVLEDGSVNKICLESDCCETSQPFTNMEGFQNNYQVVSMKNSYLIEGIENQQTFEIPLQITIQPKDDTVDLDMEEINTRIEQGISLPGLGVTIDKSIYKKNKEKQENEKAMELYKIIGSITGIMVFVLTVLYLLFSFKK